MVVATDDPGYVGFGRIGVFLKYTGGPFYLHSLLIENDR